MAPETRILITLIVEDVCLAAVCIACFKMGHNTAGSFALTGLLLATCATNTFKAVRGPTLDQSNQ